MSTYSEDAIDRVAKAIQHALCCMQGGPVPWDEESPENKWAYGEMANAALAAVDSLYESEAEDAS
jgi:hypothetical protein